MDVTVAPGTNAVASWYPDPSRRYPLRYWDGSRWTLNVIVNGQPFIDDTPLTTGDRPFVA